MLPTYVFDLDETLIHSSEAPIHGDDIVKHKVIVLTGAKRLYVHIRPGAHSLLSELLKLQRARYMRIGIWTAATAEYARKIIQLILGTNAASRIFGRCRMTCRFNVLHVV